MGYFDKVLSLNTKWGDAFDEQHEPLYNDERSEDDVSSDVVAFTMAVSAYPDTPSERDKVAGYVIGTRRDYHDLWPGSQLNY